MAHELPGPDLTQTEARVNLEPTFQPRLKDIIEMPFVEPRGLQLGNAPTTVMSRPISDSETSYLAILKQPLTRKDFFNLMDVAAPYQVDKIGGIGIILGDWDLIDRHAEKGSKDDAERIKRHAGALASLWERFGRDRKMFTDVLTGGDRYAPRKLSAVNLVTFDHALSSFKDDAANLSRPAFRAIVDDATPEFLNGLAEFSRETPIGKMRPASGPTTKDVINTVASWSASHRAELLTRYLDTMNPSEMERFMLSYLKRTNQFFVSSSVEYDGDGRVRVDNDDMSFEANYEGDSWKIVSSSVMHKRFVAPAIGWRTRVSKDGSVERELDWSEIKRQPLGEVGLNYVRDYMGDKYTDEASSRLNTLVGATVLAYLSPDIRADEEVWPKYKSLIPGGSTNLMQGAQVLVRAAQEGQHFANGSVLPQFEAVARDY